MAVKREFLGIINCGGELRAALRDEFMDVGRGPMRVTRHMFECNVALQLFESELREKVLQAFDAAEKLAARGIMPAEGPAVNRRVAGANPAL